MKDWTDDDLDTPGDGWPFRWEPGFPERPHEKGFHWMRWHTTGTLTIGQWTGDVDGGPGWWCISYLGGFTKPSEMAHLDYIGPIDPPPRDNP